LPHVFNYIATNFKNEKLFIKIHDAYTQNAENKPIIPTESTLCAIYVIRNPLDIAASFANHNNSTIDEAIDIMNNVSACMAAPIDNLNVYTQFKQLTLSWSEHVKSWTGFLPFPVMVVRYEDMLYNPLKTFYEITNFLGLDVKTAKLKKAISDCSFQKLKKQEDDKGFVEKKTVGSFFRTGSSGNWKTELSPKQIQSIITNHQDTMKHYKYL